MFLKKIKFILIFLLLYQNPLYSKSTTFNDFNSRNLSKYFSGIVAYENKNNTHALNFFNSSKILLIQHDPYLKRYIYSLVLENKVSQAINIIKNYKNKNNSNFFDANLLLIIDSLKKNDLEKAYFQITDKIKFSQKDRFNDAILQTLMQYIYVFKEKRFLNNKKDFGKLSIISETFQRCYLNNKDTDSYFLDLINDPEGDYTRYTYFYISYLIENKRIEDAKKITNKVQYINTTLLLSQGKDWVENENIKKFSKVFSCKNPNDIISEFLFLISNLYSSQNDFEKSNFYLNLSNFLNPKFKFNLSLIVENQYNNEQYTLAKKTLKNFKEEDTFFYWYRIKKEAQIIEKLKGKKNSLNYIVGEFTKINDPNDKILLDIANFYKNSK